MVGIVGYGVYIPKYRVSKESLLAAYMQKDIAKLAGGLLGNKEKAVCGWDEDAVTMAAEAMFNALEHSEVDPEKINILYFASVSSPYTEKPISPFLAFLAGMESDGTRAADFAQTTRGSTLAMRAAMDAINSGESEYAMLVASDARIGFLGEMSEQTSGDAAVAFVLGKENTIAEIEGMVSITEEFTEVWKGKEETYLRTYDARFTREKGYFRFVKKAGESLLKKLELAPDKIKHVVLEPTNAELDPLRRAEELAKTMGFSGKTRIFSRLIDKIGSPGNASIFLGLADLLDRSSPHERIICINYAAGSDAFSVLTGDEVEKRRNRKTVDAYVKSKENVDYVKYLEWKEIMKPTHDKLEGVI